MNQDESLVKSFFRNKWVRLVLVIDAIVILVIIGLAINRGLTKAIMKFDIAPVDATISVNGDSSFENGEYRFWPGVYEVSISREGLDTKTFTITLDRESVVNVTAFLSDDGNFDFYTLKENYESLQKLQSIASAGYNITIDKDTSAEGFVAKMNRLLKIRDVLPLKRELPHLLGDGVKHLDPIIVDGWDLAGEEGCETVLCLYAIYYPDGVTDDYRKYVLELVSDAGYNINDYKVIYPDE